MPFLLYLARDVNNPYISDHKTGNTESVGEQSSSELCSPTLSTDVCLEQIVTVKMGYHRILQHTHLLTMGPFPAF